MIVILTSTSRPFLNWINEIIGNPYKTAKISDPYNEFIPINYETSPLLYWDFISNIDIDLPSFFNIELLRNVINTGRELHVLKKCCIDDAIFVDLKFIDYSLVFNGASFDDILDFNTRLVEVERQRIETHRQELIKLRDFERDLQVQKRIDDELEYVVVVINLG